MIKLEKKYLHGYYLCQLPQEKQDEIMTEIRRVVDILLLDENEKQEAIENAKCEKICNLTDTVEFEWIEDEEEIRIISGTFKEGCGITVKDEKWNIYNLLVVADRKTKKPCVELHNKIYFKEDINK